MLGVFGVLGCGAMPAIEHGAGSDGDSGTQPVDSGSPVDSGTPDAGPVDSGTPDAGPTAPGTPTVTAANVVTHGTHQIIWQLPSSGCSSLSLAMKVGPTGTYSVVKMVTGTATSTQYSPGHASGTYCYEVSCTLSGITSPSSNGMCATQ